MLGEGIDGTAYHADVLKSRLTKNLPALFDGIHDEAGAAFKDLIPQVGDGEWANIRSNTLSTRLISRLSNRVLVGLPLCALIIFSAVLGSRTMNTLTWLYFNPMATIGRTPLMPRISVTPWNDTRVAG